MPTIHRERGYRFSFYSREPGEPPHVHVFRDGVEAKIWIDPIALASSDGFSAKHLRDSIEIIRAHRVDFMERWHGFFATDR